MLRHALGNQILTVCLPRTWSPSALTASLTTTLLTGCTFGCSLIEIIIHRFLPQSAQWLLAYPGPQAWPPLDLHWHPPCEDGQHCILACYCIITHPPLSSSCRFTTRLPPFLCQTSRFRSCQKHLRPSTASKPSTTCTSLPPSWRHIADTYTQPNGPCAPAPTESHPRCRGRRHRCHHPRRHHRRDHFRRDRRRDRPVRRQRLKAERPPGPQRSGHERVCLSSPPPHPNHTSLTRNLTHQHHRVPCKSRELLQREW